MFLSGQNSKRGICSTQIDLLQQDGKAVSVYNCSILLHCVDPLLAVYLQRVNFVFWYLLLYGSLYICLLCLLFRTWLSYLFVVVVIVYFFHFSLHSFGLLIVLCWSMCVANCLLSAHVCRTVLRVC
jgi:hypothetical protein